MALSCKQRLKHTVYGYIRSNLDEEISDEIAQICHDYYNKVEIIWDIFSDKVSDFVLRDGLDIILTKRDEYSTFASSIGWNKGKHSFTLQQIESSAYRFAVGIISSEELPEVISADARYYFMFTKNKSVHGYSLDGNDIFHINKGTFDFLFETGQEWITDAKVTVAVDCDNWRVTFYINDKKCNKSIDMEPSKTYHPIFTVWPQSALTFQLHETTIDV